MFPGVIWTQPSRDHPAQERRVTHGQDRLAEGQRRMGSELADHVPRVHRPRRRRGQIWASLTFHPLMASCWRIDDFYVDPLKSR